MNPNDKELLEKTYELAKENNHILRGMKRSGRWSAIFRIFYWILIIGASLGAYVYVQPYINPLLNTYKNIQGEIGNVKTIVNKISSSTSNILK
jgi:hypothetical protein